MVETSGSWRPERRSPWESYTSQNCMIAPVEHRPCGFLPASTNLRSISNLGLNGSGFSTFPEGGLAHETDCLIGKSVSHSRIPLLTPSEYIPEQTSLFQARVDVLTSTYGAPSPRQNKFLIFDQSGNDTRLIYSTPLCPQYNAQTKHSPWNQLVAEGHTNKREQVCKEKYVVQEESGENETVHEGSEMREDTEEINALLYSDDDDFDADCDDESEDDDEVSTGHSPLVNQEDHDFDEVASFDRSSKRQKALDGGHNNPPFLWATTMGNRNQPSSETMDDGDLVCSSKEGPSPTIGNKRVRKDKIRDTLRALESIVPGLKSKDPVVILDEAISYLKSLKSNAETMSMEDPDGSSCYGP